MKQLLLRSSAVLLLSAAPAAGDVVDSAPGGFTVKIGVEAEAPAARAYSSLIDVGAWWDSEHTFSGHASNLTLDGTAGGCFCEKLSNGGGVRHMTVVYADPGRVLRLNGGLGPMQDMGVAGSLSFAIAETTGKSTITLTYKVGGYLPGGLDAIGQTGGRRVDRGPLPNSKGTASASGSSPAYSAPGRKALDWADRAVDRLRSLGFLTPAPTTDNQMFRRERRLPGHRPFPNWLPNEYRVECHPRSSS